MTGKEEINWKNNVFSALWWRSTNKKKVFITLKKLPVITLFFLLLFP